MLLFATSASPSFNGGNVTTDSLYSLTVDMSSTTTDVSPTAGGTLSVNSLSLGSYDYAIKNGNQTVSSFTTSDWFTTTEDTRSAFVVVNGNLTINSGQTFIPSVRKLFTCIYVAGNLTVNGSISMTARGANHSGTGSSGGLTTEQNIRIINGTYSSVTNPQIPALSTGGAGATGAGGGSSWTGGASGTCFTGGTGGGGKLSYSGSSRPTPTAPVARGGAGGNGYENTDGNLDPDSIGAGAGNPGGIVHNNTSARTNSGTGGTLIIFVKGTLSGSGSIVSQGAGGENCSSIGPAPRYAYGGGGSGGGSINILSVADSSSITLSAAGGAGGTYSAISGGANGSAGATGTARKLTLV